MCIAKWRGVGESESRTNWNKVKLMARSRMKETLLLWLGNVSVSTTRKMVPQLKSISHRLNFIVYRYMFRSSWDHHQAVYMINTSKLIEISVWIRIVMQRIHIIKTVKVVENYALFYDENDYIKIKNIRVYKNLYLKYSAGN
jgi:hypothetical protein